MPRPRRLDIPDTVSVAITDQYGSKTTVTNYIPVADGFYTNLIGLNLSTNDALPIEEGKSFTSDVATFTFSNPNATANSFTATIDWGDPSSDSSVDAGTIKEDGDGVFHVSGTHTYLEGDTSGNAGFPYVITVDILEPIGQTLVPGPNLAIVKGSATVFDAPIQYTPPTPPAMGGTKDVTGAVIAPGVAFTVSLGTMIDSNPNSTIDDFPLGAVTINWGDMTALDTGFLVQTQTDPTQAGFIGQNYAVFGMHTYMAAGSFMVTVTITDIDGTDPGATTTGSFPIVIAAAAAPVEAEDIESEQIGFNPTAQQSFTAVVASFQGVNVPATGGSSYFGSEIDWGDGTVSPGTIQQGTTDGDGDTTFFITGTHTYLSSGTYDIFASVSTPGSPALLPPDPCVADVISAPLNAQSAPIAGTQGTPLPDDTVVATFSTTGPVPDPDDFATGTTATISWGDGVTTEGTVTPEGTLASGITYVVEGGHTYKNITDVFQAFQVTVTIDAPDGSSAVVADLAQMGVPVFTDQPLAMVAVAGGNFTVPVALIQTANPQATAADFAATIEWGDGQTSSGELQSQGQGSFEVLGSHTYANPGSFPIAITLSDQQGNTVTDTRTSNVSPPPAPAAASVVDVEPQSSGGNLVSQVLVTFGVPLNAPDAQNRQTYRLVMAGKRGSFTAKSARVIAIRSAVYNAASDTVTLTMRKPFSLSKPVELLIGGTPRSILTAEPGSKSKSAAAVRVQGQNTAVLPTRTDVARSKSADVPSGRLKAGRAVLVDALLERHELASLRH